MRTLTAASVVAAICALTVACGSSTTSPSGSTGPGSTPAATGPGADLARLIVAGPSGWSEIPSTAKGMGYETLNDALTDDPTGRGELTKDGFDYGYSAGWNLARTSILSGIAIVKYSSATGAAAIQPYILAHDRAIAAAKGHTVTTFAVPSSIPNAAGLVVTNSADNTVEYLVYFAAANYHVDVFTASPASPVTVDDAPAQMEAIAVDLASREYARISVG